MTQRNFSIDVLKFICALLVVLLHTKWMYQNELLPITRCAVPCFFMISGYLLYTRGGIGIVKLKRNIIHIAVITLWVTLLFLLWKELLSIKNNVIYIPTKIDIINWIIFNDCPFAFHLWYLYAYIYVLIIILIIDFYNKWKILFSFIPLLLMIDLIYGTYSCLFWDRIFPYIYVRNFMFVGLPYFSLGALIKHKGFNWISNKYLLVAGICLFSILTFIEKSILVNMNMVAIREHYISTTFLAICIFSLAISVNTAKYSLFAKYGKDYSLYIYNSSNFYIPFEFLFSKIRHV